MSFLGLLDRRVAIHRATEARSGTGASTRAFAPIATDVKAAIEQPSGQQDVTDPGRILDARWRCFVPAGVDVREGDRIVEAARIYDVLLVAPVRSHHLELTLSVAAA